MGTEGISEVQSVNSGLNHNAGIIKLEMSYTDIQKS